MTSPSLDPTPSPTPKRRRGLIALAVIGAVVITALALPAAFAGGPDRADASCSNKAHAVSSPAEVRDKLAWAGDRLMSRIDATDGQRAELDVVLDGLAPEAFALHQSSHGLKEAFRKAVMESGGEVDQAKLEQLRKDAVKLFDAASQEALETFVEVSDILTVEQRLELIDDAQRLHRWHHR